MGVLLFRHADVCMWSQHALASGRAHTQLWGQGGVSVSRRQRMWQTVRSQKGFTCAAMVQVSRMSALWGRI